MVGLGSIENTADLAKVVSTLTQAEGPASEPRAFTGTVAGISKAMVGLGSVDYTADAAKVVRTLMHTALDLKAP